MKCSVIKSEKNRTGGHVMLSARVREVDYIFKYISIYRIIYIYIYVYIFVFICRTLEVVVETVQVINYIMARLNLIL